MAKRYNVTDGKLLLTLEEDAGGWYVVTSPSDPAMITQARNIPEAFEMAKDAFATLSDSRRDAGRWDAKVARSKKRARPQRKVGSGI